MIKNLKNKIHLYKIYIIKYLFRLITVCNDYIKKNPFR